MNGVSHMLPFVIGGGILTAIAFLVDQPGLGTAAYGSSIPAAAFFKTIGGEAFGMMLPILAGFIAMSIADRPGLAPGFVGGMMSIDMGGPFNKAAYVFGTGALTAGTTSGQLVMASVMVGGMVPPLAIALSTTLFKSKWSKADRDAGIVNYIMGLPFITEGAIPFAAADPGHVLPSCIIGSALAGALSAAFGCTSPAPHGGAWVIAVIGNPVGYLAALAIGSVVACLILSLWKKPYQEA